MSSQGDDVIGPLPPSWGGAAQKLVEVVGAGIGRLYDPTHARRMAKAEGDARIILARAEIELSEVQERALARTLAVETRRQENLEAIASRAEQLLPNEVEDTPVAPSWREAFFEAAQDASEEGVREIWASILAGEVARPGSFSRRTLSVLKSLDQNEAELFQRLCGCSVTIERDAVPMPFISVDRTRELHHLGLNHSGLSELAAAGLIQLTVTGEDVVHFKSFKNDSRIPMIDRSGRIFVVSGRAGQRMDLGCVAFTPAGVQLAGIVPAQCQVDHVDTIPTHLRSCGLQVEWKPADSDGAGEYQAGPQ